MLHISLPVIIEITAAEIARIPDTVPLQRNFGRIQLIQCPPQEQRREITDAAVTVHSKKNMPSGRKVVSLEEYMTASSHGYSVAGR